MFVAEHLLDVLEIILPDGLVLVRHAAGGVDVDVGVLGERIEAELLAHRKLRRRNDDRHWMQVVSLQVRSQWRGVKLWFGRDGGGGGGGSRSTRMMRQLVDNRSALSQRQETSRTSNNERDEGGPCS